MNFNISSVRRTMPLLLALAGTAVFSQFATASYLDTTDNVTYELSSTFTPVGGDYHVFLALDATNFSAGNGFLVAVALQVQSQATAVTLVQAPGGVGDWTTGQHGGISNSGGSDGCSNNNANFECFQFAHVGQSPDNATQVRATGIYLFEFAVTLPAGTALNGSSSVNDIKASYNTQRDANGTKLGDITSPGGLAIDSCVGGGCGTINPNGPNTPEPGTMVMMLSGMGLVGIGAFRKLRS
jgi:hypothetical protein